MEKKVRLGVMLVCLVVLMCSCVAMPPDQNFSGNIEGWNATSSDEIPVGETTMDESQETADLSTPVIDSTPTPLVASTEIKMVEVFVDATMPMMGFVDMEGRSDYITLMDSCRTAAVQCFPNGIESAYRVDVDQSPEEARLDGGLSLQDASNPSFYLSADLTHFPAKVYSSSSDSHHSLERFNEYRLSYYHTFGKQEPQSTAQTQYPVAWAIENMNPSSDSFAIIFSDLSELQFDSSKLTTAIKSNVFGKGKTIGILALQSDFSGLVPMSNGWFIWGSEPTGTLWKMIDYKNYELGISVDPAQRQAAKRPLYVICVGESTAVNRFVNTLNRQMTSHFTEGVQLNFRAFDVDFGTQDVNIANSATQIDSTQEGLNLLDEGNTLRTVTLQRMRKGYDEVENPRYVVYEVTYPAKLTDPRTVFGFGYNDFDIHCEIAKNEKGTIIPMGTPSEDKLKCTVVGTELQGTDVKVRIRMDFPFQKFERGEYRATISMKLNPPGNVSEPSWVGDYHVDNNSSDCFDGSKTVGLNALFSHIATCQKQVIEQQYTDLGSFSIKIQVND